MARGSRSRTGATSSTVARRSLPSSYPGPFPSLAPIQDNRLFHPAGPYRAPLSLLGTLRPRIWVPQKQRFGRIPKLHQLAFSAPSTVLVCVRRRRRKEVLFARGKAGRGRMRKGKRNYWSSISCKG